MTFTINSFWIYMCLLPQLPFTVLLIPFIYREARDVNKILMRSYLPLIQFRPLGDRPGWVGWLSPPSWTGWTVMTRVLDSLGRSLEYSVSTGKFQIVGKGTTRMKYVEEFVIIIWVMKTICCHSHSIWIYLVHDCNKYEIQIFYKIH